MRDNYRHRIKREPGLIAAFLLLALLAAAQVFSASAGDVGAGRASEVAGVLATDRHGKPSP
jgi:hypothetical protein